MISEVLKRHAAKGDALKEAAIAAEPPITFKLALVPHGVRNLRPRPCC